jgi:hypothetical protein
LSKSVIISLFLVVIFAVSSIILVESAFAQTTEPSVSGSPGVGGFSVLAPSNVTSGSPFEIRVFAFYANGYIDTDFTGNVSFSASKGTVSPSMSGAFTEGSWKGLIKMSEAGFETIVYVNDGNSHTGRSAPILVYQPGSTPASSPNPTPTPTVPELSWLAILPLLAAIFFVAIRLKQTKTNSR